MARSLRSFKGSEKVQAIERRLKSETMGLGYWAAVDATKPKKKDKKK